MNNDPKNESFEPMPANELPRPEDIRLGNRGEAGDRHRGSSNNLNVDHTTKPPNASHIVTCDISL